MASIRGKKIGQVYSGRAGCACGCRGKYSNKPATILKIVNNMKKFPDEKMVECKGCCFSVEYETPGGTSRTLVAYYDR